MNAKELIKHLEKFADDVEVVIDFEAEIGWYSVEEVKEAQDGKLSFVNLVSSNEA